MTYMDGMDWAAAQQADQDLKNTWAEIITRFSNGNFRHANLLHADPHPGNYRFAPDGTVGFVDFGCVKILPEEKRRLWISIMRNVIEGRSDTLRHALVQAGFITADSPLLVTRCIPSIRRFSTKSLSRPNQPHTHQTVAPGPRAGCSAWIPAIRSRA